MSDSDPVLNEKHLESLRELNEPGDDDIVTELIDIFFSTSPATIVMIKESLEKGDPRLVEKSAHKLKGSSANIGAERLRYICEVIEDQSRDNNLEGLEDKLAEVEKSYEITKKALSAWRL